MIAHPETSSPVTENPVNPPPTVDEDAFWHALNQATLHYPTPLVTLDLPTMQSNFIALQTRAQGKPLRIATKSIRCRQIIGDLLQQDHIAGLLCFSLAEANWLGNSLKLTAEQTILVGYPTVDIPALHELLHNPTLLQHIVLMIDDSAQLDVIEQVFPAGQRSEVQVCLDIDTSYHIPFISPQRMKFGSYRSPLYTPEAVLDLAHKIVQRPGFSLVGVMTYDAQIAGLGDQTFGKLSPLIRFLQNRSWDELVVRREKILSELSKLTELKFINGGGTGSIERNACDSQITDIGAGSGLFVPHIFDHYSHFSAPAAMGFALSVTRHPQPDIITCFGGGWIASGKVGADRLPLPVWPTGLAYISPEGAGEVQTPLRGMAAVKMQPGDRVWFRHAKAGEVCEHVNSLYIASGSVSEKKVIAEFSTYRGEGKVLV